ncbi:MAG: Hsp20/alpha crystallin family protein [Deltaproteobacteria bacterium]|nr:Hsp20/alpha crystallin family protein [Deltaproteobacteria bacterium]MDQ3299296.1 Hsp20/alpha crystallin family protein [Myxococcota bacterium]
MSLVRNSSGNGNGGNQAVRYRDPFSMARELLSWDPLFGARPASAFAPAFEVKETNEAFVLKADVPGVAESDLDINVHNNVLSVSGSRQAEERKEGESYALYERQFGSFTRSFSLPDMADGERIDAHLANGVLTLTVGKKAEAKPRKIALKK